MGRATDMKGVFTKGPRGGPSSFSQQQLIFRYASSFSESTSHEF